MAGGSILRSGVADQVRQEVDIRIAQILSGLETHAEAITAALTRAEVETVEEQRVTRRVNGRSVAATIDSDFGILSVSAGFIIDQITYYASGSVSSGSLYLDDPTFTASPDKLIHGNVIPGFTGNYISTTTNIYVPAGRRISSRISAAAGNTDFATVLSGRFLDRQP